MNKLIDFVTRIGENRSRMQIETLKKRYPSMFETTTDMTAPRELDKANRITKDMKALKLQTSNSSH